MDIAGVWEPVLAEEIVKRQAATGGLLLVAIAGVPGSGKTASARQLCSEVRRRLGSDEAVSVLPMDGFHYYKRELDGFPDPQEAHFRRGAHFTFNAQALLRKIQQLRTGVSTSFPSFSHSTGDPEEDTITLIPSLTRIVIAEGLYLLLEAPVWSDIRACFDVKVFLDCDLGEAMEKTYQRNCRCLPYTPEVVRQRIEGNDRVNGELVQESKKYADFVVHFYPKSASELSGLE